MPILTEKFDLGAISDLGLPAAIVPSPGLGEDWILLKKLRKGERMITKLAVRCGTQYN